MAGLLAYSNSFSGPFVFDDIPWIAQNSSIRQIWPLAPVLFPPQDSVARGRPIVNLTLAANYAIGGTDVVGYHIVNLAIHLAAALVLFGIVRRTLDLPRLEGRFGGYSAWLAAAVALLWVVHPLGTAAVTYIIQRTEALAAVFYLLVLYCLVRSTSARRPLVWRAAAWVSCLLGMATKEVVATAPLVALLYDRAFVSGSFSSAFRQRGGFYLALAATWGVIAWALVSTRFHAGTAGFGLANFTATSYAATQPGVIVHYLQLVVWPVGLALDYGWPAATTFREIAPAAIVIGLLCGFATWALVKNTPAGFLAASFFVILGPTSSFVPIKDAAFDHRMYLPLAALVCLLVFAAVAGWKWLLSKRSDKPLSGWHLLIPACLLAAVAAGLGWDTMRRNADYRSAESIWRTTVAARPYNPRAHNNLADILLSNGRIREAEAQCRRAIELDRTYADAEKNLGRSLSMQGKFDESIEHLHRALQIHPREKQATQWLARTLFDAGRFSEATAAAEMIVASDPDNVSLRQLLADCLRNDGNVAGAIQQYELILKIEPNSAAAHNNLGSLLAQQGRFGEALNQFRATLQLDPKYPDANFNIGMIYYGRGMDLEAERYWRAAVKSRPHEAAYLRPLAWTLATSPDPAARNGRDAVELAERGVAMVERSDPELLGTLAAALAEAGDFAAAAAKAEEVAVIAIRSGNAPLASELKEKAVLYRNGSPFRERHIAK